ncbi:MAG TPA: SWIM zinc finger family protein, partial [Ktedonobacterales bacterium]|nr:SWIM zinc finger family protein [Ktedonobacterales bacterium]
MLTITSEQALAAAPDLSAAQAGRKLADPRHWRTLGYSALALWGECQGSALYQVRVELASLSVKCSCPSRKFPCKHGIGLMLMAATTPDALTESAPPDWVASWLEKRAARAEATAIPKAPTAPKGDGDGAKAAARRIQKREALVRDGLESLDLWMCDLIRNGLGELETQPARFWLDQAKRLVDAQAPGMAGRLRAMSGLVHAGRDWPQRLLDALGEAALLSHAYRQQEAPDPALRADVRSLIGWSLTTDEVEAAGDHLRDRWLVLGQTIFEDDHLRTQRTWLLGERSARLALILQFSAGWREFAETFVRGSRFQAELHFWPSAYPLRARI